MRTGALICINILFRGGIMVSPLWTLRGFHDSRAAISVYNPATNHSITRWDNSATSEKLPAGG
jgi:hypothetical protein